MMDFGRLLKLGTPMPPITKDFNRSISALVWPRGKDENDNKGQRVFTSRKPHANSRNILSSLRANFHVKTQNQCHS